MIAVRALWLCHACHDDAYDLIAERAGGIAILEMEEAEEQARTDDHPEPKDDEAAA